MGDETFLLKMMIKELSGIRRELSGIRDSLDDKEKSKRRGGIEPP